MDPNERRRRRRRAYRGVPRSRTESITREELRAEWIRNPPVDVERPRMRGECVDGERPCPFVACRYNLYLDVTEAGSLKLNFPAFEPWEMPWSCSLDEAELGGLTLEEVGERMNFTRERTRQVEAKGCIQLAAALREQQNKETA